MPASSRSALSEPARSRSIAWLHSFAKGCDWLKATYYAALLTLACHKSILLPAFNRLSPGNTKPTKPLGASVSSCLQLVWGGTDAARSAEARSPKASRDYLLYSENEIATHRQESAVFIGVLVVGDMDTAREKADWFPRLRRISYYTSFKCQAQLTILCKLFHLTSHSV